MLTKEQVKELVKEKRQILVNEVEAILKKNRGNHAADFLSDIIKKIEVHQKTETTIKTTAENQLPKLQSIFEISPDYFKKPPPKKPTLLEFTEGQGVDKKNTPFLHRGITAMLVAPGGRGKTHIDALLAGCITTGVPFLNKFHVTESGATCIILGENDQEDIHRLLYNIRIYINEIIKDNENAPDYAKFPTYENAIQRMEQLLYPVSTHGINASLVDSKGNETDFFTYLINQLQEKEPEDGWKLIILDPASRFAGPESEKDNAIATAFVACLEKISSSLKGKPTILLSHHTNKAALNDGSEQTAARGSSALTDGARWQANLSKDKDSDDDTIAIFQLTKTNFTPPISKFKIKKRWDGIPEFYKWCEKGNNDSSKEKTIGKLSN